jgi:hypothetical protein
MLARPALKATGLTTSEPNRRLPRHRDRRATATGAR